MRNGVVQWVMSLLFVLNVFPMMAVLGIVFLPWALVSPKGARVACQIWAMYTLFSARWMLGIRTEIRGDVPQSEVLVAAKHQSFLDVLIIYAALPRPKFIMKKELLWAPIIGLYAYRLGCIPISRGKRSAAIRKMVQDVEAGKQHPGQLVIYSQGTRIAPGVKAPYKIGTGVLYQELGQDCVPVATNAGLFWPRNGFLRKPGLAVVEFLPAIPAGQTKEMFMMKVEEVVESASDRLMAEAGFKPNGLD